MSTDINEISVEFDFPQELKTTPLPVVGISGLDTLNNAVHRNVWEAFKKQNRPLVNFKLIKPDHEFPPRKPKKSSYECYIPKGILKRNWMDKHLNHAPAVVIMFYDLDWNDPQWTEKQSECASRVKSLKVTLDGRHTKVALVLIQQDPPIPSGEEIIGGDKSLALIQECEISTKYLLLLPYNPQLDHMTGFVLNLQTTFLDMASVYFNTLIRDVKSHRSSLNKTNHAYLFVRHAFKIAFHYEMKREYQAAYKYYNQAYVSCAVDTRTTRTNVQETKVLAAYITYKIVRLLFELSQPRDAVQTFHACVDTYKDRTGCEELLFEHHAWLCRQYATFGDLFENAIRGGLAASQSRHPGFYYQQAARHCIHRRTAMATLCAGVLEYPQGDPLQGLSTLEYYGQRPWRPGKLSAEPPDMKKEKEGIQALQYVEKTKVRHSVIIIGLLSEAIGQFNTYRCPRMRKYLIIQMAEEYLTSRDYGKALTLMMLMLGDYRAEHWTRLVEDIVRPALYCAYVTASVREYLALSLDTDQAPLLANLTRVMNNELPLAVQHSNHAHNLDQLKTLWATNLTHEDNAVVELELSPGHSCVQVKTRVQCLADEKKYTLNVFLRSQFLEPVTFSSLSCCIGHCDVPVSSQLTLPPNQVVLHSAEFVPLSRHVNSEVTISNVTLCMQTQFRKLLLKFIIDSRDSLAEIPLWRLPQSRTELDLSTIRSLNSVFVVADTSSLSLELSHENPALLLEWYPIRIKLSNQGPEPLVNLTLLLSCQDNDSIDMCEDSSGTALSKFPLSRTVDGVAVADGYETVIYVRCMEVTVRLIQVKVTFSAASEPSILLTKEDTLTLDVTQAFQISASFLSDSFDPISVFHSRETVLIQPLIECISPWSIVIEDTSISIPDSVELKHETKCQLELRTGQVVTCLSCVVLKQAKALCLGVFTVKWRRKGSNLGTVSSCIELPRVDIQPLPLQLALQLPAHGLVRTPMTICYTLYNYLTTIVTVQIQMESSEAFIFSGYKQVTIKLVPDSAQNFKFKLYPQLSGLVVLPEFKINLVSKHEGVSQQQINDMVVRSIPSHVYVLPQAKVIEPGSTAKAIEV